MPTEENRQREIAIVDDRPESAQLLDRLLRDRGHIVRHILSGREAIDAIVARPPDLILLDIRIPDLNGYQICAILKTKSETTEIPVIFISALEETIDKVKAFAVGGADYITKPFQPEELLARIENQLTIRQQKQRLQQEVRARAKVTAALRASEAKHRALVETSQSAFWGLDAKGRIAFVNPVIQEIYGYEPNSVIGKPFLDFCAPQARAQDIQAFQKILAGDTSHTGYETVHRAKDGRDVHLLVNAIATRDADGKVTGATGTASDITALKYKQLGQKTQSAILRLALQGQGVESILQELTQQIEQFSPHLSSLIVLRDRLGALRVRASTNLPQSVVDFYDPLPGGDSGTFGQAIMAGKRTIVTDLGEISSEAVPGRTLMLQSGIKAAWVEPILSDADRVLGSVLLCLREARSPQDHELEFVAAAAELTSTILDRKRLEQERDRFFSLPLDMFCIVDFDGYFQRLNPSWETTLGYSRDELMVQPFAEFVHPLDLQATQLEIETLMQGSDSHYFENRYRCKDGSYVWLGWTATPFPEEGMLYAIARNITERKQAEETLRLQSQREQALNRVLQSIRRSFELSEIFSKAVREIGILLNAARVDVLEYREGSRRWLSAAEYATDSEVAPDIPLGFDDRAGTLPGQLRQLDIVCTTTPQELGATLPAEFANAYTGAWMVVPLFVEQKVWGCLSLARQNDQPAWSDGDIELAYAISEHLAIALQQTGLYVRLQEANSSLRRLAEIDGLTQIANRRCFDSRLGQEWHRHHRESQPLSLLLCDLDYFKHYNDAYGHQAGDDCLRQVAQTIDGCLRRATDFVARYGGEEFAIVLQNTNLQGAEQVAQSIAREVQKLRIPHRASQAGANVTVSLGVTSCLPSGSCSPESMIAAADRALYEAKHRGRNTYSVAECVTEPMATAQASQPPARDRSKEPSHRDATLGS